jgi:hypothetical protein
MKLRVTTIREIRNQMQLADFIEAYHTDPKIAARLDEKRLLSKGYSETVVHDEHSGPIRTIIQIER